MGFVRKIKALYYYLKNTDIFDTSQAFYDIINWFNYNGGEVTVLTGN